MNDLKPADALTQHWTDRLPVEWRPFAQLSRLDRPIGWQLLLLPCLMGLAAGRGSDGFGAEDALYAAAVFVEAHTDRIEQQAYDYFRRVEEMGGVIPAIEKGFFQSEIADAAYRYQREIDMGIRKIVGVNAYAEKKPLTIPILEMDPQGYERQVNRLQELRRTRDNGRVGQTLDRLRIALQGTENTMPYLMECVHAYATLGEIIQVMKEELGVYEEPTMI